MSWLQQQPRRKKRRCKNCNSSFLTRTKFRSLCDKCIEKSNLKLKIINIDKKFRQLRRILE